METLRVIEGYLLQKLVFPEHTHAHSTRTEK